MLGSNVTPLFDAEHERQRMLELCVVMVGLVLHSVCGRHMEPLRDQWA